jgi:hypothetical protein
VRLQMPQWPHLLCGCARCHNGLISGAPGVQQHACQNPVVEAQRALPGRLETCMKATCCYMLWHGQSCVEQHLTKESWWVQPLWDCSTSWRFRLVTAQPLDTPASLLLLMLKGTLTGS